MRVVIVGGGKVGSYLAGQLLGGGHAVTVIEENSRIAERLAELTANDAEKVEVAVSRMREELEAATAQPADSEAIDGLTAQLRELEAQAEKARRRAARIAVRAGTARQEARALGVLPQEEAGASGDQA